MLSTMPHIMSVFEEVEISALMGVRAKYKPKFAEKGVKLTYLPLS